MAKTIFHKSYDRSAAVQEKTRSQSRSRAMGDDNVPLPRNRQDILNGPPRGPNGAPIHRPGPIKVRLAGESGRTGFHPSHFFKIVWNSTSWLSRAVNVLWPIVPAAIAVKFAVKDKHELKFGLAYLGMIPCANLIGFAGQELSRKMPHMLGVLTETT
jgi:Ca2+:H+ antiporter